MESVKQIEAMIYTIRGHRVMLDSDLAKLASQRIEKVDDAINLLFSQKME